MKTDPDVMKLLKTAFEHHQRRQFAQAQEIYAKILAQHRDNFDALQLLGLCRFQMGQAEDALKYLNRALAIRQDVASVFNHRGIVLRSLGKGELAVADFNRAVGLNAKSADAFYNRGNTLRELGRLDEALSDYRKAVALEPGKFEYLNNLGGCLKELKRHGEALQCYDRLLALYKDRADSHYNRGLVLQWLGRCEEALASHDRCIALQPDHAEAHTNRGYCLKELKRLEEAKASYEKARSLKPLSFDAELGLARIAAETGQFRDAEERFAKVLSQDPKNLDCLCGIAQVKKVKAGDPLPGLIEERLADGELTDESRSQLHHAYAKVCNDLGRYDDAVAQFALGKELRKLSFDMDKLTASYAAVKALFTPQFFAERRNFGSGDERPVFIVGMPRSGTTLTEQILAGHRLVEGLGELPHLNRIMTELGGGLRNPEQFTSAIRRMEAGDWRRLAERYCEAYARSRPASVRLVDKRPHNFECLGAIALMFPRAHIIHCRRNAMDNCVSMYMQDFSESHGYNNDLATLGRYYRAYEDLMAHWRQVLPIQIHECVYEDTIASVEESARSLVAFLGLEWDPNCLNYHQQDRQVSTPSLWQVRQPLYDSSVGRWRHYEKHLGPLREGLGVSEGAA